MMYDPKATLERAERAFSGTTVADVRERYRAIVGPTDLDDELVEEALEVLRTGRLPEPRALAALEKAIRMFRPAPMSEGGQLPDLPHEARPSFPDWSAFRQAIKPFLYAVGRIDRLNADGSVGDPVGTGFLLSEQVLMTNRHVLWELSAGTERLGPDQAVFNFMQEHRTVEHEKPLRISRHLAAHESLDIALLEVEGTWKRDRRSALQLAPAPPADQQPIVAIGYPYPDAERNPMYIDQVFGRDFGIKRAAPGVVIRTRDEALYHDCSTLGGNSGSPLLAMSSAQVVGIHARGGFLTRNEGIGAAALQAFADREL